MKIAFYVDSTNSQPRNMEIYKTLNTLVEEGKVSDACLFFNNIDYVPVQTKFGMFNSHDMWHYTGNLITTSVENTMRAANTVNKFNIYYLYDKSQKDLAGLMNSLNLNVKVLTTTQEDQQEYYRLTGEKPHLLESLENVFDLGVL